MDRNMTVIGLMGRCMDGVYIHSRTGNNISVSFYTANRAVMVVVHGLTGRHTKDSTVIMRCMERE